MLPSSSNRNSARALANSVLPTPVGPRKMKLPMGRRGSLRPDLDRRIASDTAVTASSWPISRWCRFSSMPTSLSASPSSNRPAGMPVHLATNSAMSLSPTTMSTLGSPKSCSFSEASSSSKRRRSVRNWAAPSYSERWAAASSWSAKRLIRSSVFFKLPGRVSASIRSLLAASSMKSTALSGRWRSTM